METLETKEIESAVEAILFASGEPVQTERVCIALGLERPAAEQISRRRLLPVRALLMLMRQMPMQHTMCRHSRMIPQQMLKLIPKPAMSPMLLQTVKPTL